LITTITNILPMNEAGIKYRDSFNGSGNLPFADRKNTRHLQSGHCPTPSILAS
jgi:hypothetical protein